MCICRKLLFAQGVDVCADGSFFTIAINAVDLGQFLLQFLT